MIIILYYYTRAQWLKLNEMKVVGSKLIGM